ncbi:hypothetical protein [Desulfosediminicola ganghwensis]|uniref:hypothetical protein n=1 Tax=Desulfosediminicola ganghwensis TaxID=2569540 RepID=UPI001E5DCB92|nr:hypothetical protein [Desulfosediminicola ganghwensis]
MDQLIANNLLMLKNSYEQLSPGHHLPGPRRSLFLYRLWSKLPLDSINHSGAQAEQKLPTILIITSWQFICGANQRKARTKEMRGLSLYMLKKLHKGISCKAV